MKNTKRKPGVIQMFQNAIREEQNKSDAQNFESHHEKSNAINIALKNGYWQINQKPLGSCSIAKQSFFDQFIKMKNLKSPIAEENTFKRKARETKQKFNHIFKHKEQDFMNSFPNLETLSFTPKN